MQNRLGTDAFASTCKKCKNAKPVCDDLDLCHKCILEEIAQEPIDVGTADRNKLCEQCRKRLVRYHSYGLCLTCAAKEFANIVVGQKPKPLKETPEPEVSEPPPTIPILEKEKPMPRTIDYADLIARARPIIIATGRREASVSFLQQKLNVGWTTAKKLAELLIRDKVIDRVADGRGGRRPGDNGAPAVPAAAKEKAKTHQRIEAGTYEEVKAFVIAQQRISVDLIDEQYHLGEYAIRKLMQQMRKEGIIETEGRRSRVLVSVGSKATPPKPNGALVPVQTSQSLQATLSIEAYERMRRLHIQLLISQLGREAVRQLLQGIASDLMLLDQL
jgi:hypothetical protein